MNLQAIEIGKHQARKLYLEYRAAVHEQRSGRRGRPAAKRQLAEDELLMNSYRQLSLGRRVINLHATLHAGGVDVFHRPRLAVVRADATHCWMRREAHGDCSFSMENFEPCPKSKRIWVPRSVFGDNPSGVNTRLPVSITGRALVPSIPPWARPAAKLQNYHILWEADWTAAPVDPALLRHIAGPFYAVLAVWDLTPLERSVLELRNVVA